MIVGEKYFKKILMSSERYISIHQRSIPSIHFVYPFNPSVGSRGAGAYPSGHRARGGVHPGQVTSPSQGHTETNETNNHTHSLFFVIKFFIFISIKSNRNISGDTKLLWILKERQLVQDIRTCHGKEHSESIDNDNDNNNKIKLKINK